MILPRSSGILLHITSLPSPFGVGDLGPSAFHFADLLHEAHQQVWQVLPLVPAGFGNSPYASPSTFAGNPLLISPEKLLEDGLLEAADLTEIPAFDTTKVDFEAVKPFKFSLLKRAFMRFEAGKSSLNPAGFDTYCAANQSWLDDYALFSVLKAFYDDQEWVDWPHDIKQRASAAIDKARKEHARDIRMHQFWQYLFDKQWHALKAYCNAKDIKMFGDLPIYVAHDSADVWANQERFYLDADGRQTVVAGVPPDYFSETGQRWGNPIYRWDKMAEQQYAWWTERFAAILKQVDYVRLDHFRGFEAYWEVPASEDTAINGTWVEGPKHALFEVLKRELGDLPVIAENLGVITEGVTSIMEAFEFPGMAILQFAFDGDPSSEFLPHNYQQHLVAYTGTHDNDTLKGWWFNNQSTQEAAAIERARNYARAYLDLEGKADEHLHWPFNRALLASVAALAVLPLQDVMGLGQHARMNTPGTVGDANWSWRFTFDMLSAEAVTHLGKLTKLYGRAIV
ncbi:MAG: 4-alpha-glucanotransferase [Bacteroidota bacterium]